MNFVETTSQQIATRHGQISFRDSGAGPRCALFLHGLSGNSRSWGWQIGHFSRHTRCVAWDAPGYGSSDIAEQAGVDVYAARVVSLMDALAIERVILIGHSMGGVVAARVAARYPDRVDAVMLSCTHTGYACPEGTGFTDGHRQRLDEVDTLGPREYGLARAANMLAPGATPELIEQVADIAGTTTRQGLESAIHMILQADNRPLMRQLHMPTTVLAGEHDRIAPEEKTSALAALVGHCRRVQIPGAAHAPYLERPTAFNAALADLILRSAA